MFFSKTYQVVDTSTLNSNVEQEGLNGLELIEEVDAPIQIPTPQKKYFSKSNLDTSHQQLDTFYGIKNKEEMPIRNFKTVAIKEEKISLNFLFNPTNKPINIENWQTIILLIAILMLGFAKAFSGSRFKQSIKALMKYSVAQEINREEKVFFHRANIIFSFIYILMLSLLVYQLKNSSVLEHFALNNSMLYLLIVAALMFVYFIKYIFSKILFFILNDNSIASEYIFNVSLYNNFLGVLLIPIISIAYFSHFEITLVFVYLALPVILFIYLLRFFRLIIVGKEKDISYFYIFLYICTLEILPLVVFYRIFILE